MKSIVLVLLIALATKSCQETKIIYVGDHMVECTEVSKQKCLLIKENSKDDWTYFYGKIKGFIYEEGFTYKLKVNVKKNSKPLADASNLKYSLIKVLEIEKSISPSGIFNKWKVIRLEGMDELYQYPTIQFDEKNNRILGNTGCNNYFGSFEIQNDQLILDDIGMTRKMCPDMNLENNFINNLKKVKHFKIDQGKLLLLNSTFKILFICNKIN